jgi:hypothetical protein
MRPQSSICSGEQQAIITALENTTQTSKPTAISTDSLSSIWKQMDPEPENIRKLIDNPGNQISLIWVPRNAGISGNEAAKDALTEEIDNRETYPPQDLIKWLKKEEAMSRQQRWERGDNEMRNRKTSASWQNDTQMIISRLRTGYTRAFHRHVIEKTDTPNCPFCYVRLTTVHILWQYDETRMKRDECRIHTIWKEGREGSKKPIDYVRKIGFYHGI